MIKESRFAIIAGPLSIVLAVIGIRTGIYNRRLSWNHWFDTKLCELFR